MPVRVKGCHHCSRRRINCDRNEPQCRKCVNANIECSGLGIRYRWTPTAVSTAGAQALRKPRRNKAKTHEAVAISPVSEVQSPPTSTLLDPIGLDHSDQQSNNISHEGETEPKQVSPTSPLCKVIAGTGSTGLALQRHRDDFWAINYFGEEISQWICPFRTYDNQFKTVLVPFALSSPEVLDAVSAASFHRLAYYGKPEFHVKAEKYKSLAITGLMKGSGQISHSQDHQLAAIAVVIVLLYDDMISAQDDFRILVPILVHLITAVDLKSVNNQTLAGFLEEQLGLLLILVLPYMTPDDEMVGRIYDFLEGFAIANGGHKSRPSLAFCLRQSVTVWLRKVKNPNTDVDDILQDMKQRLECSLDLPSFDHYLTWVYFNCAASASEKGLRDFFTNRLNWHTKTFGFKNVGLMVNLLDVLWSQQDRWPSLIQLHHEYICA